MNIQVDASTGLYPLQTVIDTSIKVAVFCDLEYFGEGSIAACFVEMFCKNPCNYHIYSNFSTEQKKNKVRQEIALLQGLDVNDLAIFDAEYYLEQDAQISYNANIFVIVDSIDNLNTFERAIQLRNDNKRNYLYFHDALYFRLLSSWVAKRHFSWFEFVLYYYPELCLDEALTLEVLSNSNINLIRPIVELTGCTNILVNVTDYIPIIEQEMGNKPLKLFPICSNMKQAMLADEPFSSVVAADLIFNIVKRMVTDRKLRILYGASHRILRYEEVALFINAGFEVIPIKEHWELFKTYESGLDDSSDPLYPRWRDSCSIPDGVLERIQAIDLFCYQDLDARAGKVNYQDAKLLNTWIDIIYIPNLLPAVPRVLGWFEGLTLFRVFGEGKIMTYDEWAVKSKVDLSLLRTYDARYATMLMLHALDGVEHANILGSNVFHVGPCVSESRITQYWQAEQARVICNITLSYISENRHWQEIYEQLNYELGSLPLRFLGKNNKEHELIKNDERIVGLIENVEEFSGLLTDCRCLLDVGTSPFHIHYTPIEAVVMGIPVIFLESSGFAQEILRIIPKEELLDCGLCQDFSEAKEIIQHCLDDFHYAQKISDNQRIIGKRLFLQASVQQQIKQFADAAPALVSQARAFSATEFSVQLGSSCASENMSTVA